MKKNIYLTFFFTLGILLLTGCSNSVISEKGETNTVNLTENAIIDVSGFDVESYSLFESNWENATWGIGANYNNDSIEFGIKSSDIQSVVLEVTLISNDKEVHYKYNMKKNRDNIWRAKIYSSKMLDSYIYRATDKNGNELFLSY